MKAIYRAIIVTVATIAGISAASAQMRTSYFMEGSYFRTEMNAALAPTRGYIKLPAVGALGVNFGNNIFSVDNLFYKRDGGIYTFMNSGVSAAEFLGKLPDKGKLSIGLNTSLVGFGAHTKKLFWSFDLNLRSQTELTLSKDMFSALKSLSNGVYDLGDTHISNREYFEAALGFAIPIKDFMTFGFRVKGLLGFADIAMQVDKMYLNVTEDIVNAELLGNLRANCPVINNNYVVGSEFSTEDLFHTDFRKITQGIKSWGLAADLGFEFRLLDDRLRISVAANDIGFIKWHGNGTANAEGKANFAYQGFNLTTGEADITSDFAATMAKPSGEYTTRLTCSLNGGIEYNILNNWIAFGVLSHTEFCQNFNRTELTASVNFRIMRWLSTSFSHTFFNGNEPGVLGWALNIHPTGFHLFIGADYIDTRFAVYNQKIPIPRMMSSANVYVGVGFNLGKAKYMPCMQNTRKNRKAKEEAAAAEASAAAANATAAL